MARRPKGDGSFFEDKDNNRWVAQITLPTGKRKSKTGKNKKKVLDWLTEQRKAIKDGVYTEDDSVTFGEFLSQYMEEIGEHKLRATTLQTNYSLIRNHIEPALGKTKLVEVSPRQLQSFYKRKLKEGLSKRTVQYLHAIVHKTLEQALKWGMVGVNVAKRVDLPKPNKKPVVAFTPEQVNLFLETVKDHRWYPFFVLCAATGAREGELLALHWSEVDLANKTIQIRYTLQQIRGVGLVLAEPKTEKSRRLITLPDFAVDVLNEYQLVTGSKGLLFQTKSGKAVSPRNVIRYFKSALKEANLPDIRLHDFSRHTHATNLLTAGVHPKVVQERLGHSSIALTLDIYSSVIPTLQKDAAEKVDALYR